MAGTYALSSVFSTRNRKLLYSDMSLQALALSNLIITIWALIEGWSVGIVMWSYWSQSVSIGILWFFPYIRIFPMHLSFIAGGYFIYMFGGTLSSSYPMGRRPAGELDTKRRCPESSANHNRPFEVSVTAMRGQFRLEQRSLHANRA